MLYPELFVSLEKARWSMQEDIPWYAFDPEKLTDEQAKTIKLNAITEWSALPATEMFLRDNRGDSDFSAFMSIWFYEEQKHALVLIEYLRRFRPDLMPTEAELHAVRFEFDPAPALETLMLHFCGEVRLTQWYRRASDWHAEPVIKHIYKTLSQDEARHGGAYLKYMRQAIERLGDEARLAFAKIGVLMAASGKSGKPLHPTNLHVNQALFPNDTIQSRLPDPAWLERWLDQQICFDKEWEARVIGGILRNLSSLFDRSFSTATQLNLYRKELQRKLLRSSSNELDMSPAKPKSLLLMNDYLPPDFETKLCPPELLTERLAKLARPLVFTNGCFDILHRGHVTYLAQARALGAALVVAINTDASVRRLGKGDDRPINTTINRAAVLASLEAVDLVTWFDADTPYELIMAIRPDVLVKGGDWLPESIVGSKQVLSWGGQVHSIPFLFDTSTTATLRKIRATS